MLKVYLLGKSIFNNKKKSKISILIKTQKINY